MHWYYANLIVKHIWSDFAFWISQAFLKVVSGRQLRIIEYISTGNASFWTIFSFLYKPKQEQDAPVKVIKNSCLANNSLSDTFKSVYEVMHAYFLQGTNI